MNAPAAKRKPSRDEARGGRTPFVWIGWSVGVALLLVTDFAFFLLWVKDANPSPESVGAIAGAAISGVVAIVLSVLSFLDRRAERRQRERERDADHNERDYHLIREYLFQSLEHFTGGQQKRSVGISAVEGLSEQVPELRPIFAPLLVNQVIYVLTKIPEQIVSERPKRAEDATKPKRFDEADLDKHEANNLDRMLELLRQLRRPDLERYYEKLANELDNKAKAITLPDVSDNELQREWAQGLKKWKEELSSSAVAVRGGAGSTQSDQPS